MAEYNPVSLSLTDDGTLDRVYLATCRRCGRSWEERTADGGFGFMPRADVREAAADNHAELHPECFEPRTARRT